jgi:hypothetical protein
MPKKKKNPELESYVVIAKFSDNKYRQVLIKRENERAILNMIGFIEGAINVHDKPIEGLKININGE